MRGIMSKRRLKEIITGHAINLLLLLIMLRMLRHQDIAYFTIQQKLVSIFFLVSELLPEWRCHTILP